MLVYAVSIVGSTGKRITLGYFPLFHDAYTYSEMLKKRFEYTTEITTVYITITPLE